MAYRGEDLDLRTPQVRSGRETYVPNEFGLNGTRPRSPLPSGGRDPVVIDDTVMACCNHAYDIAQAHGASEVRLEHLVHALTRVEAAAEILEERGIREAHLRRESAAVIASEIPVGLAHSQSAPRASAEFEDVLRRASDQANLQPGNRGATVHDLLWVLLNYNREIPAIALLLRHAAGWQSWDWPNRNAMRDGGRDAGRDGVRDEPRRREPPRLPDRQITRDPDRRSVRPPSNFSSSSNGNNGQIQVRLDQMEQSLRALHSEAAADRRALTDLIRDLQRDIQDSRGGGNGGDTGVMIEQLRAVEANVEDRLEHLARTATALTDRLQGLEGSVSGSLQEGSRNWMAVGDRLKSLDKVMSNSSTSGLADLVTDQLVTVTEQVRQATQRLEALERTMETRQGEGQRMLSGLGDRLKSLDDNIAAQRREQQQAASTQNPVAVQSLIADRFQAVKGQLDQQRLDITSAMAQVVEPLTQRFAAFDGALKVQTEAGKSDLAEVHDALVKLGTNQQTLAGNLEQWRIESGGDLGIVSNRLELLERGAAQPLEMLTQLQADMQGVQQVALADYDHNRRGFKHWLFGTDDIFAGSWRDETAGVRARLKQLKDGARKA